MVTQGEQQVRQTELCAFVCRNSNEKENHAFPHALNGYKK